MAPDRTDPIAWRTLPWELTRAARWRRVFVGGLVFAGVAFLDLRAAKAAGDSKGSGVIWIRTAGEGGFGPMPVVAFREEPLPGGRTLSRPVADARVWAGPLLSSSEAKIGLELRDPDDLGAGLRARNA